MAFSEAPVSASVAPSPLDGAALERIYRERFTPAELARVRAVWRVLARRFFQAMIPADAAVLDVGCGYCHLLNALHARERVGIDANPECAAFAADGVTVHLATGDAFAGLPQRHFDVVFVSNVLEHLEDGAHVVAMLRGIESLLTARGRVVVLQPNFRLIGARYFDFIDHKTVLTEASLNEALKLAGFEVERRIVRFLPYTTKSGLPLHPVFVAIYLRLRPLWLLFGKQSLFVARRARPESSSSAR